MKENNNIIVRRAIKSDAKPMVEYINKIACESDYLTFGKGEFNLTPQMEEDFIENISSQDNALLLVAEIDGRIVGNLNFTAGNKPRISHVGEFGISVLKEFWGNGIGTMLLEELISWSKDTDKIKKINLRVRSDNENAINLYEKLGFKKEGQITREFFIDGNFYDSIFMGLEID